MKRHLLLLLTSLLMSAGSPAAVAASTAATSLTIIVPFTTGSATDRLARALAQGMTASTGRVVNVSNMGGANAIIGAQRAAKAAPDGSTVLLGTTTTHAANPHLYKSLPYDPVRDFAPVTGVARGGLMMLVHPRVPVTTLRELIELARNAPDDTYAIGSGSASSRVAGKLFQKMAEVRLRHVFYPSNPLALTDLIGGQISLMVADTATALPAVRSGRLRALATTGHERLHLLPEIPTMAEAGLPCYEIGYWAAVYAPAGTPDDIVQSLHRAFAEAIGSAPVRALFSETGTIAFPLTPRDLAAFQAAESLKWAELIREAGLMVRLK